MSTKLDYALTTVPFPLQASALDSPNTATLEVVASNPKPAPVTLKGVSITIPVGPDASQLTDSPKTIGPVAPTGWKLAATVSGAGTVKYVFQPEAGQATVGKQGLAFAFNAVKINTRPGVCTITVKEGADVESTTTLAAPKFPNGWGEVSFWVAPSVIPAGGSTTLNWSGPTDAVYTIEFYTPHTGRVVVPAQGRPPLGSSGLYPGGEDPPLKPEQTTVFTLNVVKGSFHAQQQQTVTAVPPPPVIRYFRPKGCEGGACYVYASELTLEWQIDYAVPSRRQLTWTDTEGTEHVIGVPWDKDFVRIRPTQNVTEYTMRIDDTDPAVTATVTATLIPPMPVGSIAPFGGQSVAELPAGWLYCNGQEVSGQQYPQLLAALHETHGKPRTPGNVLLPDLRGYFLRGADDGRGLDPGRTPGSAQEDALKSHTHGQKVTANPGLGSAIRADFAGDSARLGEYDQGVQTFAAGETETRPKNVACYFIIYAGLTPHRESISLEDTGASEDTGDASPAG